MPRGQKRQLKKSEAGALTPQQMIFLKVYLDPKSKTYGNAYKSALKAGFKETYARNITDLMPEWLQKNMTSERMVKKAVENLEEFLDLDCKEEKIGAFGPVIDPLTKQRVKEDNVGKMRIKFDTTKFVAERLDKKRFGQEKGNVVVPVQINFKDEDLQ
jgi:hypothetical protein